MMKKILSILYILMPFWLLAQTKVSGTVKDTSKEPLAFATVYFKNSYDGVITDEDGNFYLTSDVKRDTLVVNLTGYKEQHISLLTPFVHLDIVLEEENELKEIVIYSGKTSKKNNPAIDILKKIWENKRNNGIYKYNQYAYNKYEKIEFDLNSIDSAYMNSRIFKNMEFIFQYMDTSKITGKTYLPIFVNEQASLVYGDNIKKLKKENIIANKNSGFENNQHLMAFVNDLYATYDIYDNYIKLFDKDFTSPLSRTGIEVYNYVLADSIVSGKNTDYHIVFYPRRKAGLTFKGDFWVNKDTWAVKKITMYSSEGMNVNWVKDIYIEQEYELKDKDLYLLRKDLLMTDFAINNRENTKGVYGKRTTYFDKFQFDQGKPTEFYLKDVNEKDPALMKKPDEFWQKFRPEPLSKDEENVYAMIDTLQTNKKFMRMTNWIETLASGYIRKGNIDYGPIFSTLGFNDVEGFRFRVGGRTYFSQNDMWRLESYLAYGLKDDKFKYGVSGRLMLDKDIRLIAFAGNRRDVEQIAASLSPITDVLGRSYASSSLLASGDNSKLTNINLTSVGIEVEPLKNVKLAANFTYKTLVSASPTFSLAYLNDKNEVVNDVKQSEINLTLDYTPRRKTIGFGVDRTDVDYNYGRLFINYALGVKGMLGSDFDYKKIQILYRQPIIVGGLGRFTPTIEAGKTFGVVPLGLLSVIPGNQSYFIIDNAFSQLEFYEFITDEYLAVHLEHNFNGKLFSRIPGIRKLNWREFIGVRTVIGNISDENKAINRSGINYIAPNREMYYEYFAGIGNIFKILRIDVSWRGNYLDHPNIRKMGVKATFGFHF